MTQKLKVGDRVKIRTGHTEFEVTEVGVTGSGDPGPPSTYLVRIKPTSGLSTNESVYGDRALVKVG